MADKSSKSDEHSEEYRRFEAALKHIVSVPKPDVDARIKADKEERQRQWETKSQK